MQRPLHKTSRNKQIKIRAIMINYAVNFVKKSRTDFIIDQTLHEEQNILLDQRVFILDETRYLAFIEQLDSPSQNTEGRKRLMETKPGWK